MATIKDIAKVAGVSIATVSRVINQSPKASEASKKAVQAAMEVLDYRPNANARALVSQTTDTMGIVVGDASEPFFGAMLKGVEGIARASHKHLLISSGGHSEESEKEAIELLISKRCDSFVVHSKALDDLALEAYAAKYRGMVFINRFLENVEERCIYLDNTLGAYLATKHLLDLGHTRIAYINSSYAIPDAIERYRGYERALLERGLEVDPTIQETGAPNETGGEEACSHLLAKGASFTAIVMYNDAMSAGVLSLLADNGINIPREVSVMGFDDVIFAKYLRPKLTTMRYPIEMMSMQAARLALDLSEGTSFAKSYPSVFTPVLVVRNSVGPVPVISSN